MLYKLKSLSITFCDDQWIRTTNSQKKKNEKFSVYVQKLSSASIPCCRRVLYDDININSKTFTAFITRCQVIKKSYDLKKSNKHALANWISESFLTHWALRFHRVSQYRNRNRLQDSVEVVVGSFSVIEMMKDDIRCRRQQTLNVLTWTHRVWESIKLISWTEWLIANIEYFPHEFMLKDAIMRFLDGFSCSFSSSLAAPRMFFLYTLLCCAILLLRWLEIRIPCTFFEHEERAPRRTRHKKVAHIDTHFIRNSVSIAKEIELRFIVCSSVHIFIVCRRTEHSVIWVNVKIENTKRRRFRFHMTCIYHVQLLFSCLKENQRRQSTAT